MPNAGCNDSKDKTQKQQGASANSLSFRMRLAVAPPVCPQTRLGISALQAVMGVVSAGDAAAAMMMAAEVAPDPDHSFEEEGPVAVLPTP